MMNEAKVDTKHKEMIPKDTWYMIPKDTCDIYRNRKVKVRIYQLDTFIPTGTDLDN